MKLRWFVAVALALVGTAAVGLADPASARAKRKVRPACANPPAQLSLGSIIFGTRPQPNGCAPPVYAYGQYVGQDPDPNIRAYLRHDWQTGYDGPQ